MGEGEGRREMQERGCRMRHTSILGLLAGHLICSVCNPNLRLVLVNLASKYGHRDQTRSFKQCIRQELAIKLNSSSQGDRERGGQRGGRKEGCC